MNHGCNLAFMLYLWFWLVLVLFPAVNFCTHFWGNTTLYWELEGSFEKPLSTTELSGWERESGIVGSSFCSQKYELETVFLYTEGCGLGCNKPMNYSSSREVEKISITHALILNLHWIDFDLSQSFQRFVFFHEDYLSLNLAL